MVALSSPFTWYYSSDSFFIHGVFKIGTAQLSPLAWPGYAFGLSSSTNELVVNDPHKLQYHGLPLAAVDVSDTAKLVPPKKPTPTPSYDKYVVWGVVGVLSLIVIMIFLSILAKRRANVAAIN